MIDFVSEWADAQCWSLRRVEQAMTRLALACRLADPRGAHSLQACFHSSFACESRIRSATTAYVDGRIPGEKLLDTLKDGADLGPVFFAGDESERRRGIVIGFSGWRHAFESVLGRFANDPRGASESGLATLLKGIQRAYGEQEDRDAIRETHAQLVDAGSRYVAPS